MTVPGSTMKWPAGAERILSELTDLPPPAQRAEVVRLCEAEAKEFFKDSPQEDRVVIMRWVRNAAVAVTEPDQDDIPAANREV